MAMAASESIGEAQPDAPEILADSSRSAASDGMPGENSVVTFAARDSVVYRLGEKQMELWGRARTTHDGATITAPRIVIDRETSKLYAYGTLDLEGEIVEPAVFSDGQGGFDALEITYDFQSRQGDTEEVSSVSGDVYFSGNTVTRLPNGELLIRDGTFTTCEEDEPHYWFSSSQIHVVPDSRIVASPLVMYIRPEVFSWRLPALPILPLPYMVFPIDSGRKSGFLTPRPGFDNHGLLMSNLGYYWAINDYMDLRLEGDVHANGNWRIGERFRYAKQDVLSGSLTGEYKKEDDGYSWNAYLQHSQQIDPTAQLDANMTFIGGERENDLNTINAESIIAEQSNAYASIAKTFNDRNSIAFLNYMRSKDLRNDNSNQSITASFYQNRMYPYLDRGPDDWRSGLSYSTGVSYDGDYSSSSASNTSGYDINAGIDIGWYHEFSDDFKALFSQGIDIQALKPDPSLYTDNGTVKGYHGSRLVMPLRMQSTLYQHFQINPSVTVDHYSPSEDGATGFSTVVAGVDVSTRLYGSLDTGGLIENVTGMKAVRHTFIPTISYFWNPAFDGLRYQDVSVYSWNDPFRFGWFENHRYTGVAEGQSTIGISLRNLFHGKFSGGSYPEYSDGPGGEYSLQLLSLTAATAYNMSADSLAWSPLTLMATSNAISENLLLSAGGMYDFYSFDSITGKRIDRWSRDDGHGLLRFVKGFVNMSLNFEGERSGAPRRSLGAPMVMNENQAYFLERFNMNTGDYVSVDYGLPWQLRFSLYLATDKTANPSDPVNVLDPVNISLFNTLVRVGLSENWQLGFNTGFDLSSREMVFPMIQIFRDLHCWQFSFQWVPAGEFRSYAFQIGLKAPSLRDLRVGSSGRSIGGS